MALVEEEKKNITEENIIDVNIAGAKKTRIRINGRNDSVIELNLSDMRIAERLEIGYKKLQEMVKRISETDTDAENVSSVFKEIDNEMKDIVDYIFDSNVSEVCCAGGTMFDISGGVYRFENILEALTKLYSDNLAMEYRAIKRRVKNSTDKYMPIPIEPQDHKPKSRKRKELPQKEDE